MRRGISYTAPNPRIARRLVPDVVASAARPLSRSGLRVHGIDVGSSKHTDEKEERKAQEETSQAHHPPEQTQQIGEEIAEKQGEGAARKDQPEETKETCSEGQHPGK